MKTDSLDGRREALEIGGKAMKVRALDEAGLERVW